MCSWEDTQAQLTVASARPPGHPITEDNQLLCLEPTLQPTGVSMLGERKEREGGLLPKVPMGKVYMTLRREAERSVAEDLVDHQLSVNTSPSLPYP